jgi:hypothetical protein
MATTKQRLLSVRSNTKFVVNYETGKLHPEIELILLSVEPKYKVEKDTLKKGQEVTEFRIFSDLDGVNALIGELQLLVTGMQQFKQLSAGINSLITVNKK